VAVEAFIAHNADHEVAFDEVWGCMPRFAHLQASIWAEKGQGEKAIYWLSKLLAVAPSYDWTLIQRDEAIKNCAGRIRDFLVPRWSFTENHGAVFNDVTITNQSPFRLQLIKVTVQVTRSDGKWVAPINLRLGSLDSGSSHQWTNVFSEGGWFGSNIRDVQVSLNCAESIEN
jgi:hypothetical protein